MPGPLTCLADLLCRHPGHRWHAEVQRKRARQATGTCIADGRHNHLDRHAFLLAALWQNSWVKERTTDEAAARISTKAIVGPAARGNAASRSECSEVLPNKDKMTNCYRRPALFRFVEHVLMLGIAECESPLPGTVANNKFKSIVGGID
jgi:hypothetical protein